MASGPWDNVQLPSPPNGPAWAQAAAQLMGATGNAVNGAFNAYQQGQNFQYQQGLRNFFRDPQNQQLLQQQNLPPIFQAALKQEGLPGLQSIAPILLQNQALSNANTTANGGQHPTQATHPTAVYGITGTDTGNVTPRIPYGSDNSGAPNVNTIIGKIGANVPDQVAQNIAKSVGVSSPEDDLTSDQARVATQRTNDYLKRTTGSGPNSNPVAQSANGDQESDQNHLTPSGIGGSSAQSPRQTGERRVQQTAQSPQPAPQQPGQFDNRFSGAYGPPSEEKIQAYEARGRRALEASRTPGLSKEQAESYKDQGNKDIETANQFRKEREEYNKAWNAPTPEEKNLRSGAAQQTDVLKGAIATGQKDLEAINKAGNEIRVANQKVQLAKSLMMNPNFYSGPAEGINRAFKQWTATLGGDPNKGTPQEAFNKTISDLLSEQIRAMAQSGVGRVLVTEVQTMKNSIASMGITPASNRLLVEEVDRTHKAQMNIQEMANEYVKNPAHPYLDPQFNQLVAAYYREHPLFSERELRNPQLIAPPRMPADITRDPVKMRQWASQNGMKAGDAFVGQDGSGPYKLPAL